MQVLEKKREDIEAKADTLSDFLKMEYLESCLKTNPDSIISKYCCRELADLYEKRVMYPEAAKYMAKFEKFCFNLKEKTDAIIKGAELLIKSGAYESAEYLYKKAMSFSDEAEKYAIKRKMINFYKHEAMNFEKSGKNAGALRIYERLVHLSLDFEKEEIQKRMLELYNKLGKIKEFLRLKAEMEKDYSANSSKALLA